MIGTLVASVLVGCTSMSGLDAHSQYGCKAAPGVSCQSIKGVYENAAAGNLPFQKRGKGGEAVATSDTGAQLPDTKYALAQLSPADMAAMDSGIPVRQPPMVLRIWVAPWEDEAGDFHDQSHFYTMVHPGKWLIEANSANISRKYAPVTVVKPRSEINAELDGDSQSRAGKKKAFEPATEMKGVTDTDEYSGGAK
jgi:conjugal transfer pilus assembly protein TraV